MNGEYDINNVVNNQSIDVSGLVPPAVNQPSLTVQQILDEVPNASTMNFDEFMNAANAAMEQNKANRTYEESINYINEQAAQVAQAEALRKAQEALELQKALTSQQNMTENQQQIANLDMQIAGSAGEAKAMLEAQKKAIEQLELQAMMEKQAAIEAEKAAKQQELLKQFSETQKKVQEQMQAVQAVQSVPVGGSQIGNAAAALAGQFNGGKYVYGGSNLATGVDCSGFVQQIYKNFGIDLPHSSSGMRNVGRSVAYNDIQPGDIVCYDGHVAMYYGNGQLIEASNKKNGIKFTPIMSKDKPIRDIRRVA